MPQTATGGVGRVVHRVEPCCSPAGISPEHYTETPLAEDVAGLSDARTPVTGEALVNLVAKYLCCWMLPDAQDEPLPLEDVRRLLEMFHRHDSLNEPGDDIELMHLMRRHGRELTPLADLPRMAHAVRCVVLAEDGPVHAGEDFVGLDMDAGTGILVLAQSIRARRAGCAHDEVWGIVRDREAAARTYDLLAELGAGGAVTGDAASPESYRMLRGKTLCYVTNERLAGLPPQLGAQDFFRPYEALFRAAGPGAQAAGFFPEGLIVYCRRSNVSLILSRDNAFQCPPEYADVEFRPQGMVVEGAITPLHRLGEPFCRYLG